MASDTYRPVGEGEDERVGCSADGAREHDGVGVVGDPRLHLAVRARLHVSWPVTTGVTEHK